MGESRMMTVNEWAEVVQTLSNDDDGGTSGAWELVDEIEAEILGESMDATITVALTPAQATLVDTIRG